MNGACLINILSCVNEFKTLDWKKQKSAFYGQIQVTLCLGWFARGVKCRGSGSSSAFTVTFLTLDPFILKMMSSDWWGTHQPVSLGCYGSRLRCFTVFFGSYSFPGITLHDEPVDWAAAGDHVSLTLVGMDIIKIK